MGFPLIFDISGGELMIVLLFVLLFFGSKGLPDMARTIGRGMRQMRDASNEVQREIHRGAHDVRRAVEEQRRQFRDEKNSPAAPPPGPAPEDPDPR